MISLAERLNAAGEPAILATLFAANGSTYRPLGSMMVGGPSAALMAGGVSGGCLRRFIARRGRALTDAAAGRHAQLRRRSRRRSCRRPVTRLRRID